MNKENKLQIRNSTVEFLVFTKQAGENGIEVCVAEETVWLTQKLMAELFGVNVRTINEHLTNIFQMSELMEGSVIRKFRNTASDGKQYMTNFYNLDAIIAVGFRVNSERAVQFRHLLDYMRAIALTSIKDPKTRNGNKHQRNTFL